MAWDARGFAAKNDDLQLRRDTPISTERQFHLAFCESVRGRRSYDLWQADEGCATRHRHKEDITLATTPRRPGNPRDAAEELFKPAKKVAAPAVERPAIPNTRELVTLKIDSDVLAHF